LRARQARANLHDGVNGPHGWRAAHGLSELVVTRPGDDRGIGCAAWRGIGANAEMMQWQFTPVAPRRRHRRIYATANAKVTA
jgi:hypothetical protein